MEAYLSDDEDLHGAVPAVEARATAVAPVMGEYVDALAPFSPTGADHHRPGGGRLSWLKQQLLAHSQDGLRPADEEAIDRLPHSSLALFCNVASQVRILVISCHI
jgi:hypothetical protein